MAFIWRLRPHMTQGVRRSLFVFFATLIAPGSSVAVRGFVSRSRSASANATLNFTYVAAPAPAPLAAAPMAPGPAVAAPVPAPSMPQVPTIEAGLMPHLMWVRKQQEPPAPVQPEQCCGCRCLKLAADTWASAGAISQQYLCSLDTTVPAISWSYDMTSALGDLARCSDVQSWALTVVDLDYPSGLGESDNTVRNLFWAIDIPGSWTHFNASNAFMTGGGIPAVTIGLNGNSRAQLEAPCPSQGLHRYRLTLYALSRFLGGQFVPSISTPYHKVAEELEKHALAKASVLAQAKGSM
mmetsp:Transcript_43808/g.103572  ORF Transcript_43808/g.103572 Transcript_43808/m.103572 type:complete len:296 (+) Transcript_43808:54-941(+)